jgi:hypothetical protein
MNPTKTNQKAAPMKVRRIDAVILHAVNLLTPDLQGFDAFRLATTVERDQIIRKRKVWKADGTFQPEQLDTMGALADLTAEEKLSLRERVLARHVA